MNEYAAIPATSGPTRQVVLDLATGKTIVRPIVGWVVRGLTARPLTVRADGTVSALRDEDGNVRARLCDADLVQFVRDDMEREWRATATVEVVR